MHQSHDTTEDYPQRAPSHSVSAARNSFLPDYRIVTDSRVEGLEQRWLLHQRLRAASIVMAVCFGLFAVRSLYLNRFESLSVLFHSLLLGLLLLSLALLSSSWKPTLRELRIYEVGLFAGVTIFFMAAQYVRMLREVRNDN